MKILIIGNFSFIGQYFYKALNYRDMDFHR